jgi:hypothetical protein
MLKQPVPLPSSQYLRDSNRNPWERLSFTISDILHFKQKWESGGNVNENATVSNSGSRCLTSGVSMSASKGSQAFP